MSSGAHFSAQQLRAMSQFFRPYAHNGTIHVKNWNKESAESPVWEKCLKIIISDYKIAKSSSSIADRAITELTYVLDKKHIKEFFRAHLITDSEEMEKRLRHFTRTMQGEGFYLCLMPSNPSCFVEWERTSDSGFSVRREQVDLLIDVDLKNAQLQEAFKHKKTKHYYCAFSSILPYDQDTVNKITACFDSSISKPNWFMRTVAIASVALGVFVLVKQSPVRQWIEEISNRVIRS